MKSNRLTVISIIAIAVVFVFPLYGSSIGENSMAKEGLGNSRRVVMMINEGNMSDMELKEHSDIVILGTVVKLREKGLKSAKTAENGQEFSVVMPVALYEIDVTDKIKSRNNEFPDNLVVTIIDTNIELEIGGQYAFALYKITGDSELSDSYGIVSYQRGISRYNEETQELTPIRELMSDKKDGAVKLSFGIGQHSTREYTEFKEIFK